MLMGFVALAAGGGAIAFAMSQPAETTPPRKVGGSITYEDYPAGALRAKAQGSAGLSLEIGVDGRVSGCVVIRSAGHPALDSASCRLATERFRYEPATQGGRPVSASVRTSVTWKYTEMADAPLSAVVRIGVGRDGRVTGCKLVESSGQAGFDAAACAVVVEHGRFEPARDAAGKAIASQRTLPVYTPPRREPEPTPR